MDNFEDKMALILAEQYHEISARFDKIHNPLLKEIDPDQREWEYDGCGNKVHKGTNELWVV